MQYISKTYVHIEKCDWSKSCQKISMHIFTFFLVNHLFDYQYLPQCRPKKKVCIYFVLRLSICLTNYFSQSMNRCANKIWYIHIDSVISIMIGDLRASLCVDIYCSIDAKSTCRAEMLLPLQCIRSEQILN